MFESMPGLSPNLQAAYLERLGLDAEPPSEDALRRIAHRQVERIPYETLWIQAGEGWDIDPQTAAERIAAQGRGGYCYHLNGALGLLLRSLGYRVVGHVGAVHGPDGPSEAAVGNHLVLTVDLPPSQANPTGRWYVDSGLGDALHDPLPLIAGHYRQAPFDLTLERDDDAGGWHLSHDPVGGFSGMGWTDAPATMADFTAQHHRLSTSPESGFVQVAMAERRDATGVDVVRGLIRSRIGSDGRVEAPITDRAEWFAVLADQFDLPLTSMSAEQRDRLWATVVAAHRNWEQEQEQGSQQ